MKKQYDWSKIKQALIENFIEQDFQQYSNSSFNGIDFENGLEIFRYILESKKEALAENEEVMSAIYNLLVNEIASKELVRDLAFNLENFLKKIFIIIRRNYSAPLNNPYDSPTLSWCFEQVISGNILNGTPRRENEFYYTTTIRPNSGLPYKKARFKDNDFKRFLSDNTSFGISLHFAYHNRNYHSHNNPRILPTQISDFYKEYIRVYLYFIFKFYAELSINIPEEDLIFENVLKIKTLASLSGGIYNPQITNLIKRDNIIQTIENKLRILDVLFVEGEEGIGKTTILHQFVSKFPNSCFSYFIDDRDSNDYSILSILQAFSSQLYFELKQGNLEEFNEQGYYDEDFLKRFLSTNSAQLSSNKRARSSYFFIVDGLDKISEEKQIEIKEQILDKLPYDKSNIKLILTGRQRRDLIKSNSVVDKFEVILLSEEESHEVLGKNITREYFNKINSVTQNNAGKIVFFRDLILRIGIESFINKLSSDLKAFYNYLWSNYLGNVGSVEKSNLILALLAFHDKKYNSVMIGQLLGIHESEVLKLINPISFIRKNMRGSYEFIFDDLTSFVKIKLSHLKNKIDTTVIQYLLNDLDSVDSLIHLPEIFKETGRKDELMKLLTNERWKQLLLSSEKISVVSRVSSVALETIQDERENKYIPTLLKYSILKSALKELSRTTVWQNEIAANLVLEDYFVASNLANIAFLKEDRLKMFASIAKAYAERKIEIPNDIMRKIQELYDDIDTAKDFKNIKESAVEIASLLMYSNPKLAFKLIEDLSGSISDNDNAFDWALAQISLSVQKNLDKMEDVSKEDINTKVYSKIRNPVIKELADAIMYISENQSSVQIREKIEQLDSTSQKMFLIRNWIGNNQKDENIAEIIDLGLRLVVEKSDKYVPKSSDYKVFVTPLPYLKDSVIANELIEKIEKHIKSIESISASEDVLAIRLAIARTICNFDFSKGEERLFEIYLDIEKINDLSNRCTCLAIYSNEATRIEISLNRKDLRTYIEDSRKSITNNIDKILEQTAMHFEIVHSIITNLARLYPEDSIEISKKLNKSVDRDNAFLETLATYLNQGFKKIDINIVDKLLNNIVDIDIKKIAFSEVINRMDGVKEDEREYVVEFFKFFDNVDNIFDNRVKCLLYVKILSILEQHQKENFDYRKKLEQTWNELERSVNKIELGFEIAYNLAFLQNKDFANQILKSAKLEKDEPDLLLDSPNTSEVYNLVIDLSIRIFSGLFLRKNFKNDDIDKLEMVISSLPSEQQQLSLWASLILKIIPKMPDDKLVKSLIKSYIIPKINKIQNKNERIISILDVIVVLYYNDNSLPYLVELPSQKLKDIALSRICNFLFTKCLPDDLCDDNHESISIDHETVEKILELTNLMGNDYFIASQITGLRNSIFSKNSLISNLKKAEIQGQFEKIADNKLPDLNNIKHSGYKILVKVYALSIQTKQKWDDWNYLLEEVENIPNLSDRIFLWVSISELLPSEFAKEKQEIIKKSIDSAYKLPSYLDTVGRIQMIFYSLNKKSISGVGLMSLLENFVKVINDNPHSPFLRENYKNILDIAHSIDPPLAKTMITVIDTDPARRNTGAYLNNHYNLLEFQSKLEKKVNSEENEQTLLEKNPKFFNKIMSKKLAKLNASKAINDGFYPKDLLYQLRLASNYSISESYNTYSYFIERLVMTYENTNESKSIIQNCFKELLDVCDLVKLLSIRNADKIKSLLDIIKDVNTGIGEKENLDSESIQDIKNLLRRGKSVDQIAEFLEIEAEIVEAVKDFK